MQGNEVSCIDKTQFSEAKLLKIRHMKKPRRLMRQGNGREHQSRRPVRAYSPATHLASASMVPDFSPVTVLTR